MPNKLFICNNVSGAGLSTVLRQVVADGTVALGPPQFTTRLLRSKEKEGEEYYSIDKRLLLDISYKIAIGSQYGENYYGYFSHEINQIQRKLLKGNLIIQSVDSPFEWRTLIGSSFSLISLFFSPSTPFISTQRIIMRDFQEGSQFLIYLLKRVRANMSYIVYIQYYDYWIDTTEIEQLYPSIKQIILSENRDNPLKELRIAKRIPGAWCDINNLIKSFKKDSKRLIRELDKLIRDGERLSKEQLIFKLME